MNRISGKQLAQRIASGDVSAQDAIADTYERIAVLDPDIQAFVSTLDRDRALSHALEAKGPLAGMAVAVKDIFDTADLPTAYGSPIYTGFQPACDAAIVSLIRRAGGTVVGKTVTCEFAYMAPTPTKNPADVRRTAGGSSSGSAAAVAAGMVPFAIGTQTGGSTIRPASFCGIAGYKPTFDMFPVPGMKCFSWSLDTVGLFAATVNDVSWFAETLIGRPLARAPLEMQELVVGIPQSYPWEAPSASALQAVQRAATAIEAAGGKVKQVVLPAWIGSLYQAHSTLQEYEAAQSLAFEFDRRRDRLSPMLTAFLERAQRISAAEYDATRGLIADATRQADTLFAGIDVLLTPSAPGEAPMGWTSTGDPAFNKVWTLLGTPCVSVPGLSGAEGCPVGVQVIAPQWEDQRCLAAAALVEAAIAAHVL